MPEILRITIRIEAPAGSGAPVATVQQASPPNARVGQGSALGSGPPAGARGGVAAKDKPPPKKPAKKPATARAPKAPKRRAQRKGK